MFSTIRKFITPPIFEDEDKNSRARLLHIIVLLLETGVIFYAAITLALFLLQDRTLPVLGTIILLFFILFLIQKGRLNLASNLLIVGLWAILAWTSYTGGGVVSPAFTANIIVVIIAALLSGGRAAIVVSALSTTMGAVFVLADSQGQLPYYIHTPLTFWIVQSVLSFVAVAFMTVFSNDLKSAIKKSRSSLSALQESEERFQRIARASNDVLWDWDLSTDKVWWNEGLKTVFGYSPEGLTYDWWIEHIHPEDRQSVDEGLRAVLQRGDLLWEYEYRFKHADGGYCYVIDHAYIARDESGKVLHIAGGMKDITEGKHIESIQSAIYKISTAAQMAENLDDLYHSIHRVLESLLPANNFYIAFYDAQKDELSFPYFVDPFEETPLPYKAGTGLTEYILREKRAVLVTPEVFDQLVQSGEVESVGAESVDWIGAPLVVGNEAFGVIAVQTYTADIRLTQRELDLLTFVSAQAAMAIKRKQAEEKLRASESYLRAIIEAEPECVKLLSEDEVLLNMNPAGLKMIEADSLEQVAGKSVINIVAPDYRDQFRELSRKVFAGEEDTLIFEMVGLKGARHWLETHAVPLFDSKGRVTSLLGVTRDITERKQAEENLRESEERYRTLFNVMEEGVAINQIITDENGDAVDYVILDANPAFERHSPYTRDAIGKRARELYGMPSALISDWWKNHSTLTQSIQTEYFHEPTGRWFSISTSPQKDGRFATIFTDISERKRADDALKEAEAKYRNLIEHLPAVVYTSALGIDDVMTYVSPQIESLFGFTVEEWMTVPGLWYRQIHPNDRDRQQRIEEQAWEKGITFDSEYRMITKDGREIWIRDTGQILPSPNGGTPIVQGTMLDITDRKRAEEALHKSEQRLELFFSQSLDGFFFSILDEPQVWDETVDKEKALDNIMANQRFTDVNDAMLDQYGMTREKFLTRTTNDFFAHDLEQGRNLRRQLFDNGHVRMETFERKDDGTPIWFEGDYVCIFDEQKRITGYFCIQRDITDRKRAEEALRESQQRLQFFFNQSLDGFFFSMLEEPKEWNDSIDKEKVIDYVIHHQRITEVNDAMLKHYGATRENFLGRAAADFFAHDLAQARDFRRRLFDAGRLHIDTEERKDDGTPIWIEGDYVCMYDDQGRITGMFGIQRDVTDRKRGEEALRESEERYRLFIENSLEAVYVYDVESRKILDANPAFLNLLGYTMEELRSLSPHDFVIIDPETFESALQKVIREKSVLIGERQWRHKNGKPIDMLVNLSTVQQKGRTTVYALGYNITDRKQAEAQIRTQVERLASLRAIDDAIMASTDLRMSFYIILSQAIARLKVEAADIHLFDSITNTFDLAAAQGFRTSAPKNVRIRIGEGIGGRAAYERMLVEGHHLTREHAVEEIPFALEEGFTCFYAVPLMSKGKVRGVLELFEREHRHHNRDWIDFLNTLAGQAAIAIDNANLFDGLQKSNMELKLAYETTLEGWSRALDLRDKETEGHTQRVTELTEQIAMLMGISSEDLLNIRRGALLHDIGKMGVPDRILNKKGPLTEKEWEAMRKHPEFAYHLLAPIEYLRQALHIPYCHHEKWDGTGYPRGLKGMQIPLAARIFAVADVYDALTSSRPYRKGWNKTKAIEHIRKLSGSHFDPEVVDVFLNVVNRS